MKSKIVKLLLLFFSIIFITCIKSSKLDAEEVSEEYYNYIVQQSEVAMEYVVNYGNRVYFDLERAEDDNVSEEVKAMGLMLETISYEFGNNDRNLIKTLRAISFPVWGNYCGPGHNGNNFTLEPNGLLDIGCQQHDKCYKWGGNNCKCNKDLVEYIKRNKRWMGAKELQMAQMIEAYFSSIGALGC